MRFWLMALVFCLAAPFVRADDNSDCSQKDGIVNPVELDRIVGTAMHGHMVYVTCIASALSVENYANASIIAKQKLGLSTKGGQRSAAWSYREPSQELWEKGYEFRTQATRFAASANAAAQLPTEFNKARTNKEYLNLLRLCQDCHASH